MLHQRERQFFLCQPYLKTRKSGTVHRHSTQASGAACVNVSKCSSQLEAALSCLRTARGPEIIQQHIVQMQANSTLTTNNRVTHYVD